MADNDPPPPPYPGNEKVNDQVPVAPPVHPLSNTVPTQTPVMVPSTRPDVNIQITSSPPAYEGIVRNILNFRF